MKNFKKLFITGFNLLFMAVFYAQKPTEVPKPSEEPIDVTSTADIIIYIVLPILAVIFFFLWRARKKRQK
ncbi:MAG: hypothetical protein CL526_00135 [Aequorivita sp.]|nr:hypothetical protein [Aequorivita sp.]|tara:strand:+ start:35561 stop:35770 length:210 start_codon:yes stop_codon:yes gene_type:complete